MLCVVEKNIYIYSFSYASKKQEMLNFKVIVTILLSVSYKGLHKRCLIRVQKGVSNPPKGHLLQAYWASFRGEKSIHSK